MSSAGAVPIKTKLSTAAVGKAEAEIQAKQANVKDLKNIDIDSQHLNYEISSIPRESWWKTEEKDVNNDLSHSMSVFPIVYLQVVVRLPTLIYIDTYTEFCDLSLCLWTQPFCVSFYILFLKSKSFASLSGNLDVPNAFWGLKWRL